MAAAYAVFDGLTRCTSFTTNHTAPRLAATATARNAMITSGIDRKIAVIAAASHTNTGP